MVKTHSMLNQDNGIYFDVVLKEDYLKVVEEKEILKINSNNLFKLTKFISEERACYGRAGELSVDVAIDAIKTLEKENEELNNTINTLKLL